MKRKLVNLQTQGRLLPTGSLPNRPEKSTLITGLGHSYGS